MRRHAALGDAVPAHRARPDRPPAGPESASIDDLRRIARRRLPRACSTTSTAAPRTSGRWPTTRTPSRRIEFRPRVLRAVGTIDTSTTLLGRPLPLPLDPRPDRASPASPTRRASWPWPGPPSGLGLPYTLSTWRPARSRRSPPSARAAMWFQVYAWRDRGLVAELVQRAAEAAGYEALVLTVDIAVLGRRERDVRRGFELPPQLGLGTLLDGAVHPGWTWAFVRADPILLRQRRRQRASSDGRHPISLAAHDHASSTPTCRGGRRLAARSMWDGPHRPQGHPVRWRTPCSPSSTASRWWPCPTTAAGSSTRRPAPIDLVAPVADAVGGRVEIICDGGVRRGSDIVKAVALGADACMVGRAYLYGLGAAGEARCRSRPGPARRATCSARWR